jgi:plasmid stabilization system protein ParE
MRVRLDNDAEYELEAAADYLLQQGPDVSIRFVADYQKAIAILLQFPNAGRRLAKGARRILFADFPYQLVYRVEGEEIVIYAVAHQKRRPGYWRKRVAGKG